MPYKIKRKGNEFCVIHKDTGEEKNCHKDRPTAMRAMSAMYASEPSAKAERIGRTVSLENSIQLALAMPNPVWLGCAVTNRPHIRLKDYPLEVVEINGKKMIRVPMMPSGLYRHPQGDLDMTGNIFDRFIQNHDQGLADFEVVLDAKHQPDHGAWALFEKKHGGFVQRENPANRLKADPQGKLLVAYGIPTGDDTIEAVEKGRFRHASMEFHPDYRSNVQQTYLSSDDLREIDMSTIQLGNPYRDKLGRWANKTGGAAKNYASGYLAGAGMAIGTRKRRSKYDGGKGRAGRIGRAIGGAVGRAFVGPGLKKAISGAKYGRKKRKLETVGLTSVTDLYELLSGFQEEGQPDDKMWFNKEDFDLGELDLPEEEGHYRVDQATAEQLLDGLDELAVNPEYAHLFEEPIESEDDMPENEEVGVVDEAMLNDLKQQLAAANSRIMTLERTGAENWVKAAIAEARVYVDEHGNGHSAVLLNLVQDLMLGAPLADGTIKLENTASPGDVATYFRNGLVHLLKSIPGQVKLKSETVPDTARRLETSSATPSLYEQGKVDGKSFWATH